MADSPVTKAAIARLGVQVALPSRGDIARGIGWLPATLAGVFKAVNAKKNAELQKDLANTKAALYNLTGTEENVRNSRDAFIRKAEQDSLGDSLKAYKKSVSDGKSIVRSALSEPYTGRATKNFMQSMKGWGDLGQKANSVMNKLFKDGHTGYDLMRRAASAFYALDSDERKAMLQGLQNELIRREDVHKSLQNEL